MIEEHPLPLLETRELVRLCREEEVILVLEYIHDAMQEKAFPQGKHPHPKHGYQRHIVPDLLKELNELNEPPVKAMVLGESRTLKTFFERIQQLGLFDSMSFSSSNSIDVVPSGVHKAAA